MKPIPCNTSITEQSGDALLEALIGILLMAIIGLGLTYAAVKSVTAQKTTNTQGIAINNIREQLQTTGVQSLCLGDKTVTVAGKSIPLEATTCTRAAVTLTANGISATVVSTGTSPVTALTLNTKNNSDSVSLFGSDGKITFSQ